MAMVCSSRTKTTCLVSDENLSLLTLRPCQGERTCFEASTYLKDPDVASFVDISCAQVIDTTCGKSTWVGNSSPSGWQCCENTDCLSNNCTEDVCSGYGIGHKCSNDGECESGYYCSGFCTMITSILQDSCNSDSECLIGSGCLYSKCTALLSLDDGEASLDAKYCKSMLIYDDKCDNLEVYTNATDVALDYPFECMMGTSCIYAYRIAKVVAETHSCHCGGAAGANGYCWFITPGISTVDISQSLVYNTSECSGEAAHSTNPDILYACGSISLDSYNFYNHIYNQRKYWPIHQKRTIDACSLEFGLFDPNL